AAYTYDEGRRAERDIEPEQQDQRYRAYQGTSAMGHVSPLRVSRTSGFRTRRPNDIAARLVVSLELENAANARFLEQSVERAKAIIGFIKPRLLPLQRLLDHRAPNLVLVAALGDQRLDRFGDQIDRVLLLFLFAFLDRGLAALDRLRRILATA